MVPPIGYISAKMADGTGVSAGTLVQGVAVTGAGQVYESALKQTNTSPGSKPKTPAAASRRPASQIQGRKRVSAAAVALISSAEVMPISYFVFELRRHPLFDSPPQRWKVR